MKASFSSLSLLLLAALVLAGCSHPAQVQLLNGPPYVLYVLDVPAKFRNGTASMADVQAWAVAMLPSFPSQPPIPLDALQLEHIDIDGDTVGELFISFPPNGGTGGNDRMVFREGKSGFQYLGELWFGHVCRVAPDSSGRARVLTFSHGGGDVTSLALYVLQPDGFHEVARHMLKLADCATADGSAWLYQAFFETDTPPPEALRAVFGAAY